MSLIVIHQKKGKGINQMEGEINYSLHNKMCNAIMDVLLHHVVSPPLLEGSSSDCLKEHWKGLHY